MLFKAAKATESSLMRFLPFPLDGQNKHNEKQNIKAEIQTNPRSNTAIAQMLMD